MNLEQIKEKLAFIEGNGCSVCRHEAQDVLNFLNSPGIKAVLEPLSTDSLGRTCYANPPNLVNETPSQRESILRQAIQIVTKDRAVTHGSPERSLTLIADYWNAYLNTKDADEPLDPHEVAVMMMLMKVVRISNNPAHLDSWVDVCGYSAIGGEAATKVNIP